MSGWEYREDAKEFIDDHPRRNLRVYTAKGAKRLGFDRWANLHSLSRRRNPSDEDWHRKEESPWQREQRAKKDFYSRLSSARSRVYKGHTITGRTGAYTVEPYKLRMRTLQEAKDWIDEHVRTTDKKWKSLIKRRNPYTATETPTGKTTTGWITREGKLGGAGYTEKSAATRHRLLTRSVDVFGYRSTLGSLQALLRGRMGDDKKKKVQADKNWLMRQYQAN